MKLRTVIVAAAAAGIGYVLGTKAGRVRFEQIKARADDLAHSPKVAERVQTLTETVKKNTYKLPDPVANVVNTVADGVNESVQESKETQGR